MIFSLLPEASVTKRSCLSLVTFTFVSLTISSPTMLTSAPESSNSVSTLALLKSNELETIPSECDIPFEFLVFFIFIAAIFVLLRAFITSSSDISVISAYDVLLLPHFSLQQVLMVWCDRPLICVRTFCNVSSDPNILRSSGLDVCKRYKFYEVSLC